MATTMTLTGTRTQIVEAFLRTTKSGSIDLVVKGIVNGQKRQARVLRLLSAKNKATKRGCMTFGRKGSSLRALGFQTVHGRVAIASR